jgi:hypothetical protein
MPTPEDASVPAPVHKPGRHGFLQTFGLDVRAAALALIVDNMVFAGALASGGMLLPVAVAAGGVLGFITYKIQRHWYGDGHNSALIKGLIVGLLTAIPVPLTSIPIIGPAGVLGLLNMFAPKRSTPPS